MKVELVREAGPVAALPARSRVPKIGAAFGLWPGEEASRVLLPRVELALAPGRVVYVTGPSGSGKSVLVETLDDALDGQRAVSVHRLEARLGRGKDRPLIDLFPRHGLERVLHALAVAGLADARAMITPARLLSEGQRFRAALARAMLETGTAGRRPRPAAGLRVLLADEFASTLDRVTAGTLARRVSRWARQAGVCAVIATAHDDLLGALDPDAVVEIDPAGQVEVAARPDLPARRRQEGECPWNSV